MTLLNIAIGLVGLGAVVFVHELGHLLAAKAVGIRVDAFSLGWGRKLVWWNWRGTEYRISLFPIGGYCKMRGEQGYARALERNEDRIEHEDGSYFSVHPWRRIVVLLSGPLANVVFAVVVLAVLFGIGFSIETFPNRIVLAAEYASPEASHDGLERVELSPAEQAGLASGDVVDAINGRPVGSYLDLQQVVAQSALQTLRFDVDRDGSRLTLAVTPALVPDTGSGYIGVYPWVEPVVRSVAPGSPADGIGLAPGDRLLTVDGTPIAHTVAFSRQIDLLVEDRPGAAVDLVVADSGGGRRSLELVPRPDGAVGVVFETLTVPSPEYGVTGAIGRGAAESIRILMVSVNSLRLLFRGVDLTSAVAGPVRISYYIGDVATSGFAVGFGEGLRSLANFLALLSVVLFFMNLLPIPLLDGGQIVLAAVEWVRGVAPHPKSLYRYQVVGGVFVAALLLFALFGDILFLAGR